MALRKVYRFFTSGVRAPLLWHISLMCRFRETGKPKMARLVANRIQRKFLIFISPLAELHPSVDFRHPTGLVIGDGVQIGAGSVIYQNVTIGGARAGDGRRAAYPVIGRNVTLFAGAVVVGAVRIGDNCIIGANSVVTQDVPDNSTAVGAPARIVRTLSNDEIS